MKTILKKLFNRNAGYFIDEVIFDYSGKTQIGWILYQKYTIFGIPGYKRINGYSNKRDAQIALDMFTHAKYTFTRKMKK